MKTVLVEDEVLTRELLRTICTRELGHAIVGETAYGAEAVTIIAREKPAMVLLDLQLPGMNGFEVLDSIQKMPGHPLVLVFSGRCDDYTVYRLERARVSGFMDKATDSLVVIRDAIRTVSQGLHYFSDNFQRVRAARLADPRSFDKILTPRQILVLSLIGELLGDAEIAERLGTSVKTVEARREEIAKTLGCGTREELERYARDHGITDPVIPPRRGRAAVGS